MYGRALTVPPNRPPTRPSIHLVPATPPPLLLVRGVPKSISSHTGDSSIILEHFPTALQDFRVSCHDLFRRNSLICFGLSIKRRDTT